MNRDSLGALELRHYRYFAVLAEELHFARAADKLGISQPALSQQLRAIERLVGSALVLRSQRKVALTEVGQVLLEQARSMLRQADATQLALHQAARGFVGRLSICYVASAALSGILPRIVYGFRQQRPDVEIVLQEMDMLLQVEAVANGGFDIGFIRPPVPDFPEGLATFHVIEEPMLAVLHRNHASARKKRIDLRDLRNDTFICTHTTEGLGFYAITSTLCAKAGFSPRIAVFSPQASVLISMVAAGFGVALVPASARAFAPEDVVFLPLSANAIRSKLTMIHAQRNRSPAREAFVNAAHEWSRHQRAVSP